MQNSYFVYWIQNLVRQGKTHILFKFVLNPLSPGDGDSSHVDGVWTMVLGVVSLIVWAGGEYIMQNMGSSALENGWSGWGMQAGKRVTMEGGDRDSRSYMW